MIADAARMEIHLAPPHDADDLSRVVWRSGDAISSEHLHNGRLRGSTEFDADTFAVLAGDKWFIARRGTVPGRFAEEPTYVAPWFWRAAIGGGDHLSTATGVFAFDVDLVGARPFLGSFSIALGVSGAVGGDRFSSFGGGIGFQVDFVYLTMAALGRTRPIDDPNISISVGTRLSIIGAWSNRRVNDTAPDPVIEHYELIRPEWRLSLDVDWFPCGYSSWVGLAVRATALDVSVDLSELSRWSATVGIVVRLARGTP